MSRESISFDFTFTFEKPVVFTHAHARATPATARVDARRDLHTHRPGRRERGDWALVYGIYEHTPKSTHRADSASAARGGKRGPGGAGGSN